MVGMRYNAKVGKLQSLLNLWDVLPIRGEEIFMRLWREDSELKKREIEVPVVLSTQLHQTRGMFELTSVSGWRESSSLLHSYFTSPPPLSLFLLCFPFRYPQAFLYNSHAVVGEDRHC